ncbi:MAG: extracellular solute-binding protein [Propionibacteriaceae bacterium]|jgi:multiple sugar transport system substrate-binding protein|nr:extracellular solute-binding protein [Propionibacteriaceae bacterium]
MKRRTTIVAALGAALALALSGCADGGDDPDPTDSALTGPIEVWVMGNKGPAMEAVAAGFTQETGVAVQVQAIPWGDVRTKMSTAIASGEGPDVLQVGLDRVAEWADAGGLLDLTDRIGAYPELKAETFFPASASTMTYDGRVMTVPWIADTRVLFYRSDLLEQVGLSGPPTTWAEWTAAASALSQRGSGQYGMGFNVNDVNIPLIMTWSSGGDVEVDGQLTFTSSQYRQAVEFEHSFFADGLTPARVLADADMIAGFKDGSIPMFISGPYMTRSLADQAPELKGQWSVAPIPANLSSTSLMAGSNLGVFAFSKHIPAALAFISYLDQRDIQLAWNSTTFDLPAVQGALELLTGDAAVAVYHQQMSSAKPVPITADWGAVAQEITRATEQVNLGGMSIDQAIAELEAQVKAL